MQMHSKDIKPMLDTPSKSPTPQMVGFQTASGKAMKEPSAAAMKRARELWNDDDAPSPTPKKRIRPLERQNILHTPPPTPINKVSPVYEKGQ
jgi:hypothetical protein